MWLELSIFSQFFEFFFWHFKRLLRKMKVWLLWGQIDWYRWIYEIDASAVALITDKTSLLIDVFNNFLCLFWSFPKNLIEYTCILILRSKFDTNFSQYTYRLNYLTKTPFNNFTYFKKIHSNFHQQKKLFYSIYFPISIWHFSNNEHLMLIKKPFWKVLCLINWKFTKGNLMYAETIHNWLFKALNFTLKWHLNGQIYVKLLGSLYFLL